MNTINQVRHLYVAKSLKSGANVEASDSAGTILPKADTGKSMLWFEYMSPAGIESSDKINISKIVSAKATKSAKLSHGLTRYEITLDSTVNSGNPISGQEYLLRIVLREFIGISPEDQYFKYGQVIPKGTMSASLFYKEMASSIAKNVANETTPIVNVYVHSAATSGKGGFDSNGFMKVTKSTVNNGKSDTSNSYYDGTSSIVDDIDKIVLEQAQQEWILGLMPEAFIPFDVQFKNVIDNGDEVSWGVVTKVKPTTVVEDGHKIADLEYFCMGARGDYYRMMGYPHVIFTKYLVDPDAKYDTLDITYYWDGPVEDVQKSQRTITLVCKDDGSNTEMKALIAKINSVSGLTIADPA